MAPRQTQLGDGGEQGEVGDGEVGGGHALLRTAHIFLLPRRVERGEGRGQGFLVRPSVRSSVRSDFCEFLEFLSINVMEFQ